jgi:hypothetical protein
MSRGASVVVVVVGTVVVVVATVVVVACTAAVVVVGDVEVDPLSSELQAAVTNPTMVISMRTLCMFPPRMVSTTR